MNKENFTNSLFGLSISTLKSMAIDIRAQVSAGLMCDKDAHARINCISAVLMTKQLPDLENEVITQRKGTEGDLQINVSEY
jgi:hypothetical protein